MRTIAKQNALDDLPIYGYAVQFQRTETEKWKTYQTGLMFHVAVDLLAEKRDTKPELFWRILRMHYVVEDF